jgi:MFS family permease
VGCRPPRRAAVYTPIAVATAGATLGSGVLVDRIPLRGVLAVALLLLAAALGLAQCLVSVPLAVVYGLALGAAMGLYRIVTAVAWAHYFGRAHLGSISGAASTILIVGAAVGSHSHGFGAGLAGELSVGLKRAGPAISRVEWGQPVGTPSGQTKYDLRSSRRLGHLPA